MDSLSLSVFFHSGVFQGAKGTKLFSGCRGTGLRGDCDILTFVEQVVINAHVMFLIEFYQLFFVFS